MPAVEKDVGFVAINTIHCSPGYIGRFEQLFATRARAIDRMPGFRGMEVLKSSNAGEPYLIVSRWVDKAAFDAWVGSPEFHEGHKRGFDDLREAKERGEPPPMTSDFRTYTMLTD
jgi:heme-degrading monooxygenase HmoA